MPPIVYPGSGLGRVVYGDGCNIYSPVHPDYTVYTIHGIGYNIIYIPLIVYDIDICYCPIYLNYSLASSHHSSQPYSVIFIYRVGLF